MVQAHFNADAMVHCLQQAGQGNRRNAVRDNEDAIKALYESSEACQQHRQEECARGLLKDACGLLFSADFCETAAGQLEKLFGIEDLGFQNLLAKVMGTLGYDYDTVSECYDDKECKKDLKEACKEDEDCNEYFEEKEDN
jgi:hypothetical protein